jgi:hypothetical protein
LTPHRGPVSVLAPSLFIPCSYEFICAG